MRKAYRDASYIVIIDTSNATISERNSINGLIQDKARHVVNLGTGYICLFFDENGEIYDSRKSAIGIKYGSLPITSVTLSDIKRFNIPAHYCTPQEFISGTYLTGQYKEEVEL